MSNPTSNFGWQMPTPTDLVTDLPADFEVFGQAVDTDFVDLLGGTTGQVLSKTSATDLDFTWINNDQGDITGVTAGTGISVTSPTGPVPTVAIDTTVTVDKTTAQTLTNKTLTSPALTTPTISTATTNGDILYGTGSGALARLGIGTTGQVLNVASGIPAWATASSGLTFISKTTFSAVTSASLPNGTFTSTYENYKVILTLDAGTATTVLSMRMRASGTDATGGNYYGGRQWIGFNGVPTTTTMNGLTSWGLDTIDNATQSRTTFTFDIIRPQLVFPTTMNLSGVSGSGSGLVTLGVFYSVDTVFDALTFISGSGTVTGTYRVYGYQNN